MSELAKLVDNFLEAMRGQWEDGFEIRYRPLLKELVQFIKGNTKLSNHDIQRFLSEKNIFVCESFLRYVQKQNDTGSLDKKAVKGLISYIFAREISSRDYDERIEVLGINHAVRNYWEPEEVVDKRRVGIISDAIRVKKGEVIVDIGCGVGTFAHRVALQGAYAVGVDYSLNSIKVAKSLAEERFGKDARIHFVVADATSLPFKDFSADVMVAADFIEHVNDDGKERLLDESERLLHKNGRMVIFTPNKLRELTGTLKRWLSGGRNTRLHFGLTTRFSFEKKLKKRGFRYKRNFVDVGRPYLAHVPIVKELFALEILWVIKK